MCFVPCPLIFSWVKLMAKWYHENGIKTPLKVNHLKTMLTLIFPNVLSILFRKIYLGIQFTTKTTGASICFHKNFILPTKVIDTVSHFSRLVTRA